MKKEVKLLRAELDMIADRVAPRTGIVRVSSFKEFEALKLMMIHIICYDSSGLPGAPVLCT